MIIRILGRGQFDLADDHVDALNVIDDRIEAALAADDQAALTTALTEMVQQVRAHAQPVDPDALADSELILPGPDASLAEVHELLGESTEGLVPDA